MAYDLLQDMTTALLHAHRCMLKDVPVGTLLTNKAITKNYTTNYKSLKLQITNHKFLINATPGASTSTSKYNPRPDCSKSHHRAEVFRSAEDIFPLLSVDSFKAIIIIRQ